jgi:hypothetical protein
MMNGLRETIPKQQSSLYNTNSLTNLYNKAKNNTTKVLKQHKTSDKILSFIQRISSKKKLLQISYRNNN